jgi:asparagine N-glycosylation enzyme membrane subunit Stt3
MSTSLDGFKALVKEYRGLLTLALSASLALPLAANFLDLSPPWPAGIFVLTAVVELAVLALVYHLVGRAKKRIISLVMLLAFVGFSASGVWYLMKVSTYTFEAPTNHERMVKGDECTKPAIAVYGDRCPRLGIQELREAEYNPETLWTPESISQVRVLLVSGWLFCSANLAVFLAAFVAFHSRTKGPRHIAAAGSAAQSAEHTTNVR